MGDTLDDAAADAELETTLRLARSLASQKENWNVDHMLTYDEVAKLIGKCKTTIYTYVRDGSFPQPVYFNKTARFPAAMIEKVMKEGLSPPGTYTRIESFRSAQGKAAARTRWGTLRRKLPPTKKGKGAR